MTGMASSPRGTLYLLHFDRPYKHARHYLGNPESSRFLKVQWAGRCGEFAGLTARMRAAGGEGWPSRHGWVRSGQPVPALGADRAHEPEWGGVPVFGDRVTGPQSASGRRAASGRSGSPNRHQCLAPRELPRARRQLVTEIMRRLPCCAGTVPGDRAAGAGPRRGHGRPARRLGGHRRDTASWPTAPVPMSRSSSSRPYPNRHDPGQRVYLTLHITQTKGGRR